MTFPEQSDSRTYYFEAAIRLTPQEVEQAGSVTQAIQDVIGHTGAQVTSVEGED